MVYVKEDGSYGFSWEQQYDFLLREHPEDLENIVDSKLRLLKDQEPDKAKYYEELEVELRERISKAWDDNPNFGYKESDEVVKAFVLDLGLTNLFDDIPALSNIRDEIQDIDDDFEDADWLTEI